MSDNVATTEVTSQSPGFLGVLSSGLTTAIENAALLGNLALQQRILDQFPEASPPKSDTEVSRDTALAESGFLRATLSSPTLITAIGLGVAGIVGVILIARAVK